MQLLHFCPSLFVKHSQRALGHTSLQERQLEKVLLIIWTREQVLYLLKSLPGWRNVIVLMLRNVFATPSFPPKPRDSSDKAVILLNNAKFVQASSVAHAVCLATEGGIFHFVPSPGESNFFLVLFYRHRWKWVTAVRVTKFSSRKYWCICKRMLICIWGGCLWKCKWK